MSARGACPSEAALQAFVEGLLAEPEANEVQAHLGGCERCRELVTELSGMLRALRAAGRGPRRSPDLPSGAPREGRPAGCPEPGLLAAYADGSLRGREATRLESHLKHCAPCLAEVADLLSLTHAPAREATERAVARVLARLEAERRTAVVRLVERTVRVIQDFAGVGPVETGGAPFAAPEPAFATARDGVAKALLRWSDDRMEVECEITPSAGGALLTGRVAMDGDAAWAASVALEGASGSRGPESPDRRGRFGPWLLAAGTNRLVVAIGGREERTLELWIEVEDGPGAQARGGRGETVAGG